MRTLVAHIWVLLLFLVSPSVVFGSDTVETVASHGFANPFTIFALIVFIAGYLGITLEHRFPLHKSAIALVTGVFVWIIAAVGLRDTHAIESALHETGAEIFEIIAFLLCAMGLVEILVHYRFFDMIRMKLLQLKFDDRKQFLVISFLTFFLSAVLDNLTVTIVMIQIARRFFKDHNLFIMAANIIIMANAGGAWSPIGDVTTIMLWLAKKFTSMEIIMQAFLPSLALGSTATALLYRQMKSGTGDSHEDTNLRFSKSERVVISAALISFLFPVIAHTIGLRPYMGLLFGLGLVWSIIELFKMYARTTKQTHLDTNIESLLQKVDISSLQFFIGILLAVAGLKMLGILDQLSILVLGSAQEPTRVIFGNIFLGLFSAIVDNVPLTALAIDMVKVTDPSLWVLLAITVGTGGSVLIIGSVSGIIAMGMVKELTFDKYLKVASIPALAGYVVGIAVWYFQHILVFF